METNKTVARIVSRGKLCGLFIPVADDIPEGVFEVRSVMGELSVVFVGESAISSERLGALKPSELFVERFRCAMTLQEFTQQENTRREAR